MALERLLVEGMALFRPQLILGGLLHVLVWKDLAQRPRHWADLFTFNHERPYPDAVLTSPFEVKWAMLALTALVVVGLLVALLRARPEVFGRVLMGSAVLCALALSWQHWPALGRHWTQRELVQQYFANRQDDEPLGAFLMNWKGETFYSRNQAIQISARDPKGELIALASQPGPAFVLVEHARLPVLRGALGGHQQVEVVAPETMNKFALVRLLDL